MQGLSSACKRSYHAIETQFKQIKSTTEENNHNHAYNANNNANNAHEYQYTHKLNSH